jgi:hypothetical protein
MWRRWGVGLAVLAAIAFHGARVRAGPLLDEAHPEVSAQELAQASQRQQT